MQLLQADHPDFMVMWKRLVALGGHLDALYSPVNLAFYQEYCGAFHADDLSRLVVDAAEPLCGVRVFRRSLEAGVTEIACLGLPLLYVERPNTEASVLGRAQRLLRGEIKSVLQAQSGQAVIRYVDTLNDGCLSPIGRLLLDMGGEVTPSFRQIINTSLPEAALHKGLTKAYKWAVNWSKKNLTIKVIDQASIKLENIEQFRLLHVEAAGRETRTRESWMLQYDMVRSGEAFAVFAWMQDALVSAALFPHSRAHCFYGVSASRRDLFEKPLSHGVIWAALLHAKELGIPHFEMGEQLFPKAPRQHLSEKEFGISFFKRAFGGEAWVSLDVCLNTNPAMLTLQQSP